MGNKQNRPTQPTTAARQQAHSSAAQNTRAHLQEPSRQGVGRFLGMGSSVSVKKHVDTAEKTGVCQLSKMGISEWPQDLNRLIRSLRTLDLSENKLCKVPPFIANFTLLKNIQLDHNRLVSLPEEIGQLIKLESLNLSSNQLTALPQSLGSLKSLKSLDVSHNHLTVFPVVIYALRNLDNVNLSSNRLTSVPGGIAELQSIELNLNQNQISVLSEDIASCPRLKVLRLEENCLEKAMITAKILKHSQISLIALDGNMFPMKDFPHMEGYEEYQERFAATKRKME